MKFLQFAGLHVRDVGLRGKTTCVNIIDIGPEDSHQDCGEVFVLLRSTGRMAHAEPEQIVKYDDGSVAAGPRDAADDRQAGVGGDLSGDFSGDGFEQQHAGAGLFESLGVADELSGACGVAALSPITHLRVDMLRQQTKMRDYRDAATCGSFYQGRVAAGHLDLHGVGTGFDVEASSPLNGGIGVLFNAAGEGQIGHDK